MSVKNLIPSSDQGDLDGKLLSVTGSGQVQVAHGLGRVPKVIIPVLKPGGLSGAGLISVDSKKLVLSLPSKGTYYLLLS